MTSLSQTITFSVNLKRRTVENGARVVGFLMVAIPTLLTAKIVAGPDPVVIPLPLPYQESTASKYRPIDDRELDCLAANIYYESRNQPALGQLAVGLTTVIRAREARWSNTVCGVVMQSKQFSWVNNLEEQTQRFSNSDLAYLEALTLSSKILSGDYDNVIAVFKPTHFHTTKVNPKWNRNMAKLARINDHIFYE